MSATKSQIAPSPEREAQGPHTIIDWLQFCLKTAGVTIAVIGAYQAWSEYKATSHQDLVMREHDLKQKFFEHKLTVFDQALSAAGDVVIASPAEFQKNWTTLG